MLKAGTQVVGGVNARKADTTVLHHDGRHAVELPVFASVAEAIAGDRRRCVDRVRASGGFTKSAMIVVVVVVVVVVSSSSK